MESNSKTFIVIALSVVLSVSITIGSIMFIPSIRESLRGSEGPIGLTGPLGPQGEQGSQGPQGPQGTQGDRGDKGDPFIMTGHWEMIDAWLWDENAGSWDYERTLTIDTDIWRIYWWVYADPRDEPWLLINIFEGDSRLGTITYTTSTANWYSGDQLLCFGKGDYTIAISFSGQDSINIVIEKWVEDIDSNI